MVEFTLCANNLCYNPPPHSSTARPAGVSASGVIF